MFKRALDGLRQASPVALELGQPLTRPFSARSRWTRAVFWDWLTTRVPFVLAARSDDDLPVSGWRCQPARSLATEVRPGDQLTYQDRATWESP